MSRRRNLIEIIVDRVGNVNVFNLIKEDDIPVYGNMHSMVDDDLIQEYIDTVKNIYKSYSAHVANDNNSNDNLEELKEISQGFYNHLFPGVIKEYLSKTKGKYIQIRADEHTFQIPWELLYDGDYFLSERFYMGRGLKCDISPKYRASLTAPVKMLIIVDPTGTLKWADYEAGELEKQLKGKFSNDELVIEILSNKEIAKLKLLNAMRGKDIIHFIGHSVDDETTEENAGWKIGKEKLLKAREIENANISPVLVFSHSCKSAGRIARAFLKTGARHFIGCREDVLEIKSVVNFVSRFYYSALNGHSLGRSFADSMHKYNKTGLLSFNYVLFSNPKLSIQTFNVETGKKTFLKPGDVIKKFPYPVAETYRRFLVAQKKNRFDLCIQELENTLLWTIRLFSYIIIKDLKRHSLFDNFLKEKLSGEDINSWKDFLYSGLSGLINLRQDLKIPDVAKVFYLQKENIEKMLGWIEKFDSGNYEDEELPELIIVFHYLLDSLLMDLIFITRYDLLYFIDDGIDKIFSVIDLNSAVVKQREIEIHENIEKQSVILFDIAEERKVLDLSEFISVTNNDGDFIAGFMSCMSNGKPVIKSID